MSGTPADKAPASNGTRKKKRVSVTKFDSDIAILENAPMAGAWLERLRFMFNVESMSRGLEAAQLGKVRKLAIEQGCITAQVKSEMGDTRRVSLHLPLISEVAWERIVEAMSVEAIYAACLLDRQWPPDLDSLCLRFGIPLVPGESEPVDATWDITGQPENWRVAALGWMFAQRLGADPLMMLEIRGQSIEALSDRLRQQRTLMTRGGATTHPNPPIDSTLLAGVPLADCVDRFWKLGTGFDEARRPAVLDHVPHALLRRLGASTMEDGKFPLSGLLATIYDTVADDARQLQDDPDRARGLS